MKIAIISLGCPKNQVDADVFCRALLEDGHTTVTEADKADVIIINTCGFIQSAKEEAIEQILTACTIKHTNPAIKIVVTGCLAERYQQEIAKELPEVDAVVGIGSNAGLPDILKRLGSGAAMEQTLQSYGDKRDLPLDGRRVISTPRHYAWLKIAEGCDNCCSYCAIPAIRGPLRSRTVEACVAEARWLAQQGVKEIVLVAQDVTAFGLDRGQPEIIPLMQALSEVDGVRWIRLLYAYPERVTPEFARAMAETPKVVPYLDLPIQHINDDILRSMRRRGSSTDIRNAVKMLREAVPDITLRTTLIVGYPEESEKQFEQLCDFVREMRFERLGCFAYSAEEGTVAADMPGQIPEAERQRRAQIIMEMQARIALHKQEQMSGRVIEVLCDEIDMERGACLCRGTADAPEIDGNVLLDADIKMQPGEFYMVRVTEVDVYDLYAVLDGE